MSIPAPAPAATIWAWSGSTKTPPTSSRTASIRPARRVATRGRVRRAGVATAYAIPTAVLATSTALAASGA